MKKVCISLLFLFSLASLSALPWVDEAFRVVTTGTPRQVQRAIETDYSFSTFTQTDEGENLLMAALKNSRGNDIVNLLLNDAKISPDSKTKSGVTAFMYACQYEKDPEVIENVLNSGIKTEEQKMARILAKDNNGLTSFDYARKNETISEEVVENLGEIAEEPEKEPAESDTEESEVTETAEENPAEPAESETAGIEEVPEEAAPVVSEQALEVSKEADLPIAEVEVPPPEVNALFDLAGVGVPAVVSESIHLYDYAVAGEAALVAIPASLIAAEEAARTFIPNANNRDSNGKTQLMLAAKKGDITLIENLLYSGAQIDAKDDDGWTALMYAARFQKNPDVTKLLLYKGADRTLKNKYGLSPLLLAAAYSENSEVVAALLESYSPDSSETHEALSYGISNYNEPKVLQAFVDKKVSVNIPYDGKTPLMLACQTNRNTKIIDWLLKNGASRQQIESTTGKTAFDYAKENRKLPHNSVYWSLNPNS